MLCLYFHQFILGLISSVDPKYQDYHTQGGSIVDSNLSRIYKIDTIMNLNYSKNISLNMIADELKISTRQVNRIIQGYYGLKFKELISEMRMRATVNLLCNTNLKIIDICNYVGYNSLKGFYAAFKNRYGCLPSEYRKKCKTNEQNKSSVNP